MIKIENNIEYKYLQNIEAKLTEALEVIEELESYLDEQAQKDWIDDKINEIFDARLKYDKKRKREL
ncbi:MAG: hypothetical protein PF487_13160 [Bacteroidales bacterium]|jgi:ppGpp synthetase/RelA/SpoT-type nucleotidyltranferase|nr:hypothetical protein [Bacteroidales bacterium]